jgi:signal transduction histidine kinase
MRRERTDLRMVVSNAIETLRPQINGRNHHLTTALPDRPVWLNVDPMRLEQVFVNLLTNASKCMDMGGELAVWVHTRHNQAVVRIRDSGIGIAPDALAHTFDLRRRADAAGLGIGLASVRNQLELQGGSVTAASAGLGRGSEFTVRLPMRTDVTDVRDQTETVADGLVSPALRSFRRWVSAMAGGGRFPS